MTIRLHSIGPVYIDRGEGYPLHRLYAANEVDTTDIVYIPVVSEDLRSTYYLGRWHLSVLQDRNNCLRFTQYDEEDYPDMGPIYLKPEHRVEALG